MITKTYFKTKDYCKVKFTLKPENAETVAIAGLNGDWQNLVTMTKKKDGTFIAEVSLPKESQHEFKYVIDEKEWINEPEADKEAKNEYGGSNSVIVL
jgi:1,4-alpha-glucan branching enzyme